MPMRSSTKNVSWRVCCIGCHTEQHSDTFQYEAYLRGESGFENVVVDEQTREHYAAIYARPHAMHDAFEQFGAFSQDAVDNKALLAQGGKLTMPVLAIGAEKSFGAGMADELRFVASNVSGRIVPNSGHWIMEENPQATVKLVTELSGNPGWTDGALAAAEFIEEILVGKPR